MIKVSNYIANFLVEHGFKHTFSLVGGGSMHLNDAFGKHSELAVIYNHHEQACAMAAESYARLTGNPALVCVTTGPGGINTLNGVFGAWTDSLPMIIISGQIRYETTVRSSGLNLRQLGDQECDIVKMVESITKYAVMVTDENTIKYHLEKAWFLANSGRKGPVWLDIPMNVQGAFVEEKKLQSFNKHHLRDKAAFNLPAPVAKSQLKSLINRFKEAQAPVVMLGTGVRIAQQQQTVTEIVKELNIPVVTAFNAHDLITDDNPCYIGRPGTVGDRAGNLAVQNADFLLVLGCRLNIRQIGYNVKAFAKQATIAMVDVDLLELQKPTLNIELPIHADLKAFCPQLLAALKEKTIAPKQKWLAWCLCKREKYPVALKQYWNKEKPVNPYCFMHELGKTLPENSIVVTGDGTACVAGFQTLKIKQGQRLYSNSGCASMGYDLPAAMGACVGSAGKPVVCITGDGSIQQNIQELATIIHYGFNIKLFVLNNNGYHSQRQTVLNFFGEELIGCCPNSGVGFPNLEKLTLAYGLPYFKIESHKNMDEQLALFLKQPGARVCEVMIDIKQNFEPKMASQKKADGSIVSGTLENLKPFLSEEELADNVFYINEYNTASVSSE